MNLPRSTVGSASHEFPAHFFLFFFFSFLSLVLQELIAQKIHLKAGDKHLDLGCGWGTFINYCAKNYRTASYGVTLGLNQTAYQAQTAATEGLVGRAKALCMDYRDVPSNSETKGITFDKITCLEMSEHVGVKNYPAFVKQVREMLADDGIFYLQIAGLRRAWQFEDFNWGLFMGKYGQWSGREGRGGGGDRRRR